MADQDTMYWHKEATKFWYRIAELEAALSEIRVAANNADSLADLRRDVKHIAIEALLAGKVQEKCGIFSCEIRDRIIKLEGSLAECVEVIEDFVKGRDRSCANDTLEQAKKLTCKGK